MKEKVSFTLASDVLAEVDKSVDKSSSRSAFIETVLRTYFKERVRQAIDARDVELINNHADYLNREMEDVLQYQAPIEYTGEDH
jgi:metal-responsive CopG/Arc/MetJ family transcriptional regulator